MTSAERQNAINQYIENRFACSFQPPIYMSSLPEETRFRVFPMSRPASPPPPQQPFNTATMFLPTTTTNAPGYSDKVDLENELRGQVYALQRSSQAVDVPDSRCDLYAARSYPSTSHVRRSAKKPEPVKFMVSSRQLR